MRIIIRHCLPWGNFATNAIEIDPYSDVETLMERIAERFKVEKANQVLKYKKAGGTVHYLNSNNQQVKLAPGNDLDHYGIKEKCIIFLEDTTALIKEDDERSQSINLKGGYFAKLGLIRDGDTDDLLTGALPKRKSFGFGSTILSDSLNPSILSTGDEDFSMKDIERKKRRQFKERVEKLLKEVKANSIEKIKEVIKSLGETDDERTSEARKLVNEIGQAGWSGLHFAVFLGYLDVVKFLFPLGADPNVVSIDGWTPLQLAIHKNHTESRVLNYLLKQEKLNVNELTNKGTALHIAAKFGKLELVNELLELGANPLRKNEKGLLPFEVASNEKIRTIIETAALKVRDTSSFKPPKPPLVKGLLFKRSEYLYMMNKRFLVLNPDEGTLMRFMKPSDYPEKPKEIIPLQDISSIRRMNAGTFYDKNLYYIQLLYTKRYILACKTEEAANKWVTYIIQGIVYANYLEDRLRDELSRSDDEASVIHHYLQPTTEEIDLVDDPNQIQVQPRSANKESNEGPSMPNSRREERKDSMPNSARASVMSMDDMEGRNAVSDERISFNSFEVLKILGSGAFGKVYKVRKRDDGKIYALKALKKRNLILKNQLRYAVTECNVLKTINHPFLLGLHYAFQTPQYLYLVLDYCPGGDLSLHLAQRVTFTEEETKFFVAELILAIEHLHSKNIIYRDLKPENILIGEDGHIKLADFGLSKEGIDDNETAISFCGSPAYLSPEMLKNKGVGKAADIYGIGTVIYEMLCGNSPYYNDDIPKMYTNIRKAKLTFPKDISEKAKSIMLKLLERDPATRLGSKSKDEIKKDPFFEGIDWKKLEDKSIKPPKLDPIEDDSENEVPLNPRSIFMDYDYNDRNKTINRVRHFTFVRNSGK